MLRGKVSWFPWIGRTVISVSTNAALISSVT